MVKKRILSKKFQEKMARDPSFQKLQLEKAERRAVLRKMYDEDQRGMLDELAGVGVDIDSVWDLVNTSSDYSSAYPVLIKHLYEPHHPKILAGILRALSVPGLICDDLLWGTFVDIYVLTPSDRDIESPVDRGAQEAAAVALKAHATKERVSSLQYIVSKVPEGDAIEWIKEKIDLFEQ